MESKNFTVLSSKSAICWTGRKPIGWHRGTIAIKEGTLTLINGKLEAGKFVVDTTSVGIADIADPIRNAQFEALLTSDEFLSSEKFPEATFEIISVFQKTDTEYYIEGNLTIKGVTAFASFDTGINISGDVLNATARFVVNRRKYKLKFHSGNLLAHIKDALTNNDIDVKVDICAEVLRV
jgi:polyisoprenoid-binding protein YceI